MKGRTHPIAVKALLSLALALATLGFAAESLSALLQKGIFTEETEGNLDAAIKIYQQILAETEANRSLGAQAQYRLGVCYQKKGDKEQAISAFNDLLKRFPAEAALAQKARELLAGLGQTPPNSITIRKVPLTAAQVYSVSPDGRLVAYKPTGSSDLVINETATGKTWTAVKGKDGQGVWNAIISPDGRMIAYQLSEQPLYVARIDGSEAKQVYQPAKKGEVGAWVYAWLPEGGRLVVESWGPGLESTGVGTLDVNSGTMKEIKRWTPSGRHAGYCVSANGRYLAYRQGAGTESQRRVAILDLESATETTLVEKEVGGVVGWSPGDAKLLFLSARTGTIGLWAIPVREGRPAGEPELVKANVGDISPLGLTRDGSIYYTETKSSECVYLAAANFETGELAGQRHRVLERFPGSQSKPVWSKDGQRLMLAVQVQDKQRQFVAVSMASGEHKDFPVSDTFTMPLQQYAWSPDGTFLLVQAEGGIHRYGLTSGTKETLIHVERTKYNWLCHPRFAPDGTSFYYVRREFTMDAENKKPTDWKDSVVSLDLRSGREEVVCASPDKLQIWWPFELSPDGQRLALVTSDEFATNDFVVTLKVRGLRGPQTKEVARMAPRENVTSLAWTPDGKRIVYTKKGPGKENEAWSTAVDSGQSVELKFSLPRIRDIAVHPDGRQVAFVAGLSGSQELWVMENALPSRVATAK